MKILAFLVCLQILNAASYKKVIHNIDPQAKCLDGSPGILFVHEGGDKDKILMFMEGGGWCGELTLDKTLESCYQRSKTLLGSSKYWPEEFTEQMAQGYLSMNPKINPFATWTKFIFGYCDGSQHQGYNSQPIKYKDTQLYFRGSAITRSHFDWINSVYALKNASQIILTGGSAGGAGVHVWNNYLKAYVNNPNSVYTIDDSGIFMNQNTVHGVKKYQTILRNIYKLANTQESTPFTECNHYYKNQEWKCLLFQYGFAALAGKFMVINSEYDSWSIPNILQIKCLKAAKNGGETLQNCTKSQMNSIQVYRSAYMETIEKFIQTNPEGSVWSIACSNHVYACLSAFYDNPYHTIPFQTANTVKSGIQRFVLKNERVIQVDFARWPGNKGCQK